MEDNLLIRSLIILSVILIILFGSLFFNYIINNQKPSRKQSREPQELRVPIFGKTKYEADKIYDRNPMFSKEWIKFPTK